MSAQTDHWKLEQIHQAVQAFDAIRYRNDIPWADIIEKAFWTLGVVQGHCEIPEQEALRQMAENASG